MVYDAIRNRNVRGGRFGYRPPVRLTPAAQRRRDRIRAEELAKHKFPVLEAKLDRIAEKLRAARMSGKRFAYKVPLRDLYKLAYDWVQKGKLQKRIGRVAALRAITLRANANPFNVLVRAVLGASAERKVVSRWSVPLTKALKNRVLPKELGKHI